MRTEALQLYLRQHGCLQLSFCSPCFKGPTVIMLFMRFQHFWPRQMLERADKTNRTAKVWWSFVWPWQGTPGMPTASSLQLWRIASHVALLWGSTETKLTAHQDFPWQHWKWWKTKIWNLPTCPATFTWACLVTICPLGTIYI